MTDTALSALPDVKDEQSIAERARHAAAVTMETARIHPYATAGIAVAAAAAIGGAAYAATRRTNGNDPDIIDD